MSAYDPYADPRLAEYALTHGKELCDCKGRCLHVVNTVCKHFARAVVDEYGVPRVSDEQPKAEDRNGLSGEAMPARSAEAETPLPLPDVAGIVERLRAASTLPLIRDAASVIETQAQSLASKDAEIERLTKERDDARYALELSKGCCLAAEAAEARIAEMEKALEGLHLFREFVLRNVARWNVGVNMHPIWLHTAGIIGDRTDLTNGPEWEFIQGENRETLAALRLARQGAKP